MKNKSKMSSGWLSLYLIAGAGCAILVGEGLLSLRPAEHHLVLILTLVAMFWFMQQWLNASRFKMSAIYQDDKLKNQSVSRVQSHYRRVVMAETPAEITIQHDVANAH